MIEKGRLLVEKEGSCRQSEKLNFNDVSRSQELELSY